MGDYRREQLFFCLSDAKDSDTLMTYLHWGCDPLTAECESCLDALCNVCSEEFRNRSRTQGEMDGPDGAYLDSYEPDCDRCDLEKKPDCSRCEIILQVCSNCSENGTCEFRITG